MFYFYYYNNASVDAYCILLGVIEASVVVMIVLADKIDPPYMIKSLHHK